MPKASKPKTPTASARRRGGNGDGTARPCTHEEIAARAYSHFLARGCQHGDDLRDWFRAEAELREDRERMSSQLQPTS
ncbi:MAG TPA: DUF2934 domain-containing protein [Candidatus Sulfotelmatobacter sp.]|nr:DUF2934 domain-containing protein [Candidatus Sulfotelmatobacter sp.]